MTARKGGKATLAPRPEVCDYCQRQQKAADIVERSGAGDSGGGGYLDPRWSAGVEKPGRAAAGAASGGFAGIAG